MAKSTDWTGEERREYCKLCKSGTDKRITASTSISTCLLVVCFILSGIAWSAKTEVENQKEIVTDIRTTQLKIKDDLTTVVGFIKLLQDGKIKPPELRSSHD